MHNSNIVTAPLAATRTSFFQTTVLRILSEMRRGYLTVRMPDGEIITYGDPGSSHRARIHILNPAFFRKCVLYGDIGFGESYVDGDWETDDITAVISWFLLNIDNAPSISGSPARQIGLNLLKTLNRVSHRLRENSVRGSKKNISEHYDLSNNFFRTFLDPSMTYSSAYFKGRDLSLEEAQKEKYDRLCRKLRIGPNDHVLEIGSGWGGFAIHAASTYGCKVTTITISEQQYNLAKQRIRRAGLEDRISIRLQDYRTLEGQFDKVVSIEMLEAVGDRYFEEYFAVCNRVLTPNGLLGLQVITAPDSRYEQLRKGVDWIQKHIFPGSLLPSIGRLNRAANKTSELFLHDLKDLGRDYAATLKIWRDNFNAKLARIQQLGFDERFARKWNYYFSYCESAFAMRNISVVQMVYTRPNNHSL